MGRLVRRAELGKLVDAGSTPVLSNEEKPRPDAEEIEALLKELAELDARLLGMEHPRMDEIMDRLADMFDGVFSW